MDEDGRRICEREELLKELKEVGLDAFNRRHCGKTEQRDGALLRALGDKDVAVQDTPSTVRGNLNKELLKILRDRKPIPLPSTVEEAAKAISAARHILVLTGAGISTSCGIPDFRSSSGLFAQLKQEAEAASSASNTLSTEEKPASSSFSQRPIRSAALAGQRKRKRFAEPLASDTGTAGGTSYGWIYDLVDPQEITDIKIFKERPEIFYSFADRIYPVPGRFPSASHEFIKTLEEKGKLLRNYSQNVDTLESVAGIKNVITCHGSFATASCCRCGVQVPGKEIESAILGHNVPICKKCKPSKTLPRPVMKPDITFFNERITSTYDELLTEDREKVDLLIVMGTSLPVPPIKDLPFLIPHRVPQILINRDRPKVLQPDIWLQGDCDEIVVAIRGLLSW